MEENSELSKKSKKLLDKIDLLTEKIETEKSPLKRHLLSFKVKRLIARIQKEIDLNNIKDYYQGLKDDLKLEKEENDAEALDSVALMTNKIKRLQMELRGNEEYDAESQYFMYPQQFVKQTGGVDKLVEKLKQSSHTESQQAAQRIEAMAEKRKEIEAYNKLLEQAQDDLKNGQKDYRKQQIKHTIEEKSMLLRRKVNFLPGIASFFRTIGEQAKSYIEEKLEDREFKKQQKEEERETNRSYRECIKNLKQERRQAMKQARKKRPENRDLKHNISAYNMAEGIRDELDETLAGKENSLRAQVKVSQGFMIWQDEIYQAQSPQEVEVLIADLADNHNLSESEIGQLIAYAEMRKLDLQNNSEGPQQPDTPEQEQGEDDEVDFDIK